MVVVWLLRAPKPLGVKLQVTPLLLGSFTTVAVMVDAWPGFKEVELADNVIVSGIPAGVPLLPHAPRKANPATKSIAENARTLPPLPYVIGIHSLRQLSGIVDSAGIGPHVAVGLNYQSRLLNV